MKKRDLEVARLRLQAARADRETARLALALKLVEHLPEVTSVLAPVIDAVLAGMPKMSGDFGQAIRPTGGDLDFVRACLPLVGEDVAHWSARISSDPRVTGEYSPSRAGTWESWAQVVGRRFIDAGFPPPTMNHHFNEWSEFVTREATRQGLL